MELESIAYIEEINKNPDLKAEHEKERMKDQGKKMDFINIPVIL